MPRGRWIQQVVMARNGCAYSRTDDVAIALNEELMSAKEPANQRLYNRMSCDPWAVFWATCKQDSQRNSEAVLMVCLQAWRRSRNDSISTRTLTRAPR
eukprot:6123393-Pyramimonas_sp.AAC.1